MPLNHCNSAEFSAPTYEIYISSGWDTESQGIAFIKELKKLKLYKKALLFSGFDGDAIDKESFYNIKDKVVYCSTEANLKGHYDDEGQTMADSPENAIKYACEYEKKAVAIYDPTKMKKFSEYEYKIKDPSALIAIILIK
ncbi:hypothetical protein GF340_05975 [Candidatus Peregrinibacteria bacterium]|nr:hypothetical protein [Candidatus Peregrinibacteria bacterium]